MPTEKVFKSRLISALRIGLQMTCLFAFISCCSLASAVAQEVLRTIHLGRGNVQDPVKIVELLVNGKPVQHGVPFEAGNDWLQNTSVVVQNRSSKVLTCVQISIEFPELRDQSDSSGPVVMTSVTVGVIPEHQLYTTSGDKINVTQQPAININPGQTVQIPISISLATIKSIVEPHRSISGVTQSQIWITKAFFADQTRWALGLYARPDPHVPGKYDSISLGEFTNSSTAP
jgi:hypothetical protein